jgi:hypothetical protein
VPDAGHSNHMVGSNLIWSVVTELGRFRSGSFATTDGEKRTFVDRATGRVACVNLRADDGNHRPKIAGCRCLGGDRFSVLAMPVPGQQLMKP